MKDPAVKKETRKRKAPQDSSGFNQLTNYFASNIDIKSDNESKENIEAESGPPKRLKRVKNNDSDSVVKSTPLPKITIFLKKDQNTFTVSSEPVEPVTPSENPSTKSKESKSKSKTKIGSQGLLQFKKSPQKKEVLPKIQKNSIIDFYKKVEGAYTQEEFPIAKELLNKMNEDLKKRFNFKKLERFFNTSMKQFLRSSPDQLWSHVYQPHLPQELISDKYAKMVKLWLKRFFRDQKSGGSDTKATSRSMSDLDEFSMGFNQADFEKELLDMKFTPEEQDLLRSMNYKSLLLVGKEGRGKLRLIQSVCNELNLKAIEICNSSNRSSSTLDQIYEATQSQNVFMNSQASKKESNGVLNSQEATQTHLSQTQSSRASLVVVRDFDKPLEADKGFQTKILKLEETSKSPFILVCQKVPNEIKNLQNLGFQDPTTPPDRLSLEKFALEDVALLFYVILTIEKNFSKSFKEFRYKVQTASPDFIPTFQQDLKEIMSSKSPEQVEALGCYDDILEITKYFEGNLTRLFTTFEFYKGLIYERNFDQLKEECFLASEAKHQKKPDILFKYEKDQFSRQFLENYRGSQKKVSLHFYCNLDYLSKINKLTKALDFFSEPESNLTKSKSIEDAPTTIAKPDNNRETLAGMAEFLDRMGTLDVLETKILNDKIEPEYEEVDEEVKVDLRKKKKVLTSTGESVQVGTFGKDTDWNQFELEEKIFGEIQRESLLNPNYLATLLPNEARVFVKISPYDEAVIVKMMNKLKRELCKRFSDSFSLNEKDLESVNEYLVTLGNTLNIEYKSERTRGKLRLAKLSTTSQEKGRIEANIYIKSLLCHELAQIRRDIRMSGKANKEIDIESPFGAFTKESDVNDYLKMVMTFSCAFYNKESFSEFHTTVLRDCE